jgi:hypothetical protein
MTNNNSNDTVRRAGTLAGLVGEYLAAERLRALGWDVDDADVFGGQRRHYDLRAVSPSGWVAQVSVKTSTHTGGGLVWQRPGLETVAPWVAAAAAVGEQAVVLGLHVEPVGPVRPVEGGFFFPTPRVIEYGALDAEMWGRRVDEARASYAATPRKDGRGLLSAAGLRYPVIVHELDWLHNVLHE